MDILVQNALLYGILTSAVLVVIMLTSALLAPDMWVGDYPPDIKEKYGPMSEAGRKMRPYIAVPFFLVMLVMPILGILRLGRLTGEPVGFVNAFLTAFLILLVFNLFDLLVLDWLIFATLQPKIMVLPGTEGMAGYRDYRFHFIGFLKGIVFCLVGGLFLAGVWLLIQSLS